RLVVHVWSASNAAPLQPGVTGSLVVIDYAVQPGAQLGAVPINLLGGAGVGTTLYDRQTRPLTLTEPLTSAADDRVDGLLTIQAAATAGAATSASSVPTNSSARETTSSPRAIVARTSSTPLVGWLQRIRSAMNRS